MTQRRLLNLCATACLLLLSSLALAGQPCGEVAAIKPEAAARSAQLAAHVREALDEKQLSFALVARIGLNLAEYGLRYSHVAVAWRDHPRGRWYTFHLLNRCGTGQSELVEQPLEEFFNVELFDHEALIAAPSFPMQLKLQKAFFGPQARQLHEREYNMIAHPYSTLFQNSNQWLLEVTSSALAPAGQINSRADAQAWLKTAGFQNGVIPISTGKRIGARLFSPHIRFSDHTLEEAQSQRYQVVTVESIIRFLKTQDPALTEITIR